MPMEIEGDNNAHSYSAPDVPINERKSEGVYGGEIPMKSAEEFQAETNAEESLALSVYEMVKGVPYTIKYFGIDERLINGRYLTKTLEIARKIDEFVIKEVEHKKYIDSLESYRLIIEKLKNTLKIDRFERPSSVFDKLYSYIKTYRNKSAYKK